MKVKNTFNLSASTDSSADFSASTLNLSYFNLWFSAHFTVFIRWFLVFQVFVNFAKDQSDDYHSKDSVRRRDVVIDVPTLSSDRGAAEGTDTLRESVMWPRRHVIMFRRLKPGLDLQLRGRPLLTCCDVILIWILWAESPAASCHSMQITLWRRGAKRTETWITAFSSAEWSKLRLHRTLQGLFVFLNQRWRIRIISNSRFKTFDSQFVFYLCV